MFYYPNWKILGVENKPYPFISDGVIWERVMHTLIILIQANTDNCTLQTDWDAQDTMLERIKKKNPSPFLYLVA